MLQSCTRHPFQDRCYELKGTLKRLFGVGNIKILWLDLPPGKRDDLGLNGMMRFHANKYLI